MKTEKSKLCYILSDEYKMPCVSCVSFVLDTKLFSPFIWEPHTKIPGLWVFSIFFKRNIILGRCLRMQGGGLWGHVEGEEHNPLRVTYICFSSLLLFCMLVAQFSTLVCCPSKCTEVQHSKSPSTSHFPFWRAAVSQSLSLYWETYSSFIAVNTNAYPSGGVHCLSTSMDYEYNPELTKEQPVWQQPQLIFQSLKDLPCMASLSSSLRWH